MLGQARVTVTKRWHLFGHAQS